AMVIAVSVLLWQETQPDLRMKVTSVRCRSGILRSTAPRIESAGFGLSAGPADVSSSFGPALIYKPTTGVLARRLANAQAVSPFAPFAFPSAPRSIRALMVSLGRASEPAASMRIGLPPGSFALASAP